MSANDVSGQQWPKAGQAHSRALGSERPKSLRLQPLPAPMASPRGPGARSPGGLLPSQPRDGERQQVPARAVTHLGILREDVVNQPLVPGAQGAAAAAHTCRGREQPVSTASGSGPGDRDRARVACEEPNPRWTQKGPSPRAQGLILPGAGIAQDSPTCPLPSSLPAFCWGSGAVS